MNKEARENNITPSHGLKIKNWNDVNKSGKIEDVILRSSKGTFTELISVTENKSYFRAGSSGINWHVKFDIPDNEFEFSLKEISFCFPDLDMSVKSWLDVEVPYRVFNNLKLNGNKIELEIQGKCNPELLDQIFPATYFNNLEIVERNHTCIVKIDSDQFPNLAQKWVSAFQVIGDPCVVPPFRKGVYINDISTMYAASFIFGTISRYYPTTWSNINKGINNDSVLPFALNLMDFLQDKYPKIVLDFIESPYEFEKK